MKEAEDIYSHLREKLEGSWLAYYDFKIAGNFLFPTRPRAFFKFLINADKKLEMQFDPTDNFLFTDVDQNVSHISLRHIQSNKYSLTYYFSNKRHPKPEIVRHIDPEFPHQEVSEIEVEVFGILMFEEPSGTGFVTEMTGEWFDLNGNMKKIGLFLKEKTSAELLGRNDFLTKLSDLPPDRMLSARMGEIIFRRN